MAIQISLRYSSLIATAVPSSDSLIQFPFNLMKVVGKMFSSGWPKLSRLLGFQFFFPFFFFLPIIPSRLLEDGAQKNEVKCIHNMIFAIPVIFFFCLFVPVGRIPN